MAAALVACAPPKPAAGPPAQSPTTEAMDTATDTGDANASPLRLRLRWTATPGGLSASERDTGLAWSLSLLGGRLPADPDTWRADEGDSLLLHLDQVAFPVPAQRPLAQVVEEIRASPAYQQTGAVDLGRFLMRTLYEPWWYYAITGACPTLDDWTRTRTRSPEASYAVTASLLVDADRLISLNAPPYRAVSEVAFRIQTFPDGPETASPEAETLDVMESGQQRFGIYNEHGHLVPAADPRIVAAGQPGKCMWCHEGGLQAGSPDNPHSPPHLDYEDWMSSLEEMNRLLAAHRERLEGVAFDDPLAHTWSEWLVHELLRPRPARVAAEWGVSEAQVLALVAEGVLSLGPHAEWPERGEVLDRWEVDALGSSRGIPPRLEILADERDATVALEARPSRPPSVPAPGCW